MLSIYLVLINAFDYSPAQNWGSSIAAGGSLTFDLYSTAGGTVPVTVESFDVTLLNGSGDINNAKTVYTLLSGVTSSHGITVTIPKDTPSGPNYFIGLIAKSGPRYSGGFSVTGGSDKPTASASSSKSTTTSVAGSTTGNTKATTAGTSASSLAGYMLTGLATINMI